MIHGMRVWLAGASAWVIAAWQGLIFAALLTGLNVVQDHSGWTRALASAAIAGALFTLLMWFVARREQASARAIVAGLTAAQQRDVFRAAATGAAPQQPELKAAALALARHQLVENSRRRTFSIVVFAVLLAVCAALAATGTPWYGIAAVVFVAALIDAVRSPSTLRRRVSALAASD
jgi:hypothetical protein